MRARVSAKEPEISPKRPRCLLEVRRKITPRCGPGLAAGGLWVRQAGARACARTAQGARDKLQAGRRACRTLWRPGLHSFLPTFPNPGSICFLPFLLKQASGHGQSLSVTSGKDNGPYLLPVWEIRVSHLGHGGRKGLSSQLPVAEQPLSLVSGPVLPWPPDKAGSSSLAPFRGKKSLFSHPSNLGTALSACLPLLNAPLSDSQ